MRKNLIAILILAYAASGCVSNNARSPGRDSANSFSQSCYGGQVYVPC